MSEKDNGGAVLNDDGSLKNFVLTVGGKPFRCSCGCNCFHKPDREDPDAYECNACETRYTSK